jgi:hypothetical protein
MLQTQYQGYGKNDLMGRNGCGTLYAFVFDCIGYNVLHCILCMLIYIEGVDCTVIVLSA